MRQNMHETSGDLRISFKKVPCQGFTLVAQATEDTFRPWKIIDKYNEESVDELRESGNHHHIFPGCCSAICECVKVIESPMSDIEWIFEEVLKKTQAFNKKLDFNARLTTGIRLGGWLLMAVGLIIAFSPIAYIISLFPLLGNFLGSLTSFFFTLLVRFHITMEEFCPCNAKCPASYFHCLALVSSLDSNHHDLGCIVDILSSLLLDYHILFEATFMINIYKLVDIYI
jgi:hypothetical protein